MDEEKNGLTADEYAKDELTYIQYKKQKQAALLDANEELKSLVSAQRANKGESEEDEKEAENKLREYLKAHNEGKENRLLKYQSEKIKLVTPGEFIRRMEADG